MEFLNKFQEGLAGKNKGLSAGLKTLNIKLNGVQKRTIYSVGASPKVGKTTFVDFSFVLAPYLLNVLKEGKKVKWIYLSYEINKIRKMFRLAPFFFFLDYKLDKFTHKGKIYGINGSYLEGKLLDDDEETIKVLPEHQVILKEIYENRLKPLFEGDKEKGIKPLIYVFENRTNPTGIRNLIFEYAKSIGNLIYEPYKDNAGNVKQKIAGYKQNDEELHTIIILDHIRKPTSERGFTLKQNIDKILEYQVEIRNLCGFTFVNIAHLNRSLDNLDRLKFAQEFIHPSSGDFKDSGRTIIFFNL